MASFSFFMRDIIVYPTMQSEELTAELQPIRFARISPAAADQFIGGLSARQKLAGEKVAHFGGFMDASWRTNDIMWGRLDAAEILIRKLLPMDKWDTIGRRLVAEAHSEIVAEMKNLGMGVTTSDDPRDRKALIGRQGVSAIPLSRRVRWILRGTLTMVKIGRRSIAESRAGGFLKPAVTALDYTINLLTWGVMLVVVLLGTVSRWPVARRVMGVVAIMAAGILLWNFSLHDLYTSVRTMPMVAKLGAALRRLIGW